MTTSPPPAMPAEGDLAPDVSLPDDSGTLRRLADERGRWVVLYFYPTDDTPGCTTEACGFRDLRARFDERDAVVWGVSRLGIASKAAFKSKYGLDFPLLADEDHAVAQRYGVWVEKSQYGRTSMGIKRATFLVDPDGRIARVWPAVKPEDHASDVLDVLDSLREAARTG